MSTDKSFNISNIEQLETVALYLIEACRLTNKLVLLYGDLGAGKTTLVKQVVKILGSEDDTSSPTYSLVNEYTIPEDLFYHIDLYRINDTHEAIDMGIVEYIDSKHFCFIEWPEVILPLIDEYISVKINIEENRKRNITINIHQ